MHPFESISVPALPPRPRSRAITSILDKGLGPMQARDLLAVAGEWIDVVKLGWASARMTGADALREKLNVYRDAGVRVCTGGTFLELAVAQDRVAPFLEDAHRLGLRMIEVSNGVHPMSEAEKLTLISTVRSAGFSVWSEVGKKAPEEDARLTVPERIRAVERELEAGSEKVVLEARESGTVGIYDRTGQPSVELLRRMVEQVGVDRLVFEAPLKSQQVWMIRELGPQVNLGNIAPDEALALATLRTGLRADTFADFHLPGTEVFVSLGVRGALDARRRGGIVVVIDALRASATIIAALASGMRAVRMVAAPEDCVGEVTAGERGGRKLPNVLHGNSPTELLAQPYRGKELVLTTTNGAEVLITAAGPETRVLVGTTLNARAVAAAAIRLAAQRAQPITLLMAGRNNDDAIEDALAAQEILQAMGEVRVHGGPLPLSSALEADFFKSDSGRNLVSLGYAEDVRFCAQVHRYDLVPTFHDGRLVPLEP